MIPDARCEVHGEPMVLYHTVNRGKPIARTYCRACRRERDRKEPTRNSPLNPRCRNGHPKTRFNHRVYGGTVRCVPCAKEAGRRKR